MFLLIWLVLCLVAGSVILLPLALWLREIYKRYSGSRLVSCPENQQAAAVSIDARHAAVTGMNGCPDLRLLDCTRWPERSNCDQACLSHAVQTQPYTPPDVKVRTKQIYHLPIVLAAFAAWYLGAIWHSQYVFRTRWLDAVGLTRAQGKQIVWWYSPHLLTAAVCLLFAYGVAWLLIVFHRKGVLQGVLMSVLLCGAVVAMSWYGIARLPHDLLMIEAGYTVLATFTVGAIVGALYNKPVLRW
jgi:Protein of unknown function (DUF1761)